MSNDGIESNERQTHKAATVTMTKLRHFIAIVSASAVVSIGMMTSSAYFSQNLLPSYGITDAVNRPETMYIVSDDFPDDIFFDFPDGFDTDDSDIDFDDDFFFDSAAPDAADSELETDAKSSDELTALSKLETKPKTNTADEGTIAIVTTPSVTRNNYKHDFTYDHELWEQKIPRIVVMVGPHKTASTTLQTFVVFIAGLVIKIENRRRNLKIKRQKERRPHPSITNWVFPLGVREEYNPEDSLGGGIMFMNHESKFYAPLAAFITGRRYGMFFPYKKNREQYAKHAQYYRLLFRQPLQDGKNVVIAAEAFDSVVKSLNGLKGSLGSAGEEMHIDLHSSDAIDALLDTFPLENLATSYSDANGNVLEPLIQMDDIEIQVNLRTPRISHVTSIWHQLGHGKTFRHFLTTDLKKELYQSNSLAVALQYVRKGLKTTIVSVEGVSTKEIKSEPRASTTDSVIDGLQGVLACDILRLRTTSDLCDDDSRLYLSGYEEPGDLNIKEDRSVRNLTDEQMNEIDRLFDEYDCSVWQYLKVYQEKGLLRILYPTENLFGSCNPDSGSRDITMVEILEKAKEIASRDNGIPEVNEEKKEKREKKRKKRGKKEKKANIRKSQIRNN